MNNSAENRRLAFVIEALTVGGAEQMLVAMANRFVARGWTVHMVCLTTAGELAAKLHTSVHLTVLDKRPGLDWRIAQRLRKLLLNIDPCAINSHLWTANLWTRVALPLTRHRIVVTEHSRDTWKPIHYRLIDRLLALWTHALVAVSHDTRSFYTETVGISRARTRVINNGIETLQFARGNGVKLRAEWAPHDELLIGTVGRLVAAKNHKRLVEVAQLLDRKLDQFKIIVVGEGELRETIQAAIDTAGMGHRIALVGARQDIPDVLDAFDVFVLSSDREGHPLTALEAQAAGTPVVLTDAGGSRDALACDGEATGGAVVHKSAEALALALADIAQDPVRRNDMGAVAQRVALEKFDLDAMVDSYQSCFTDET